MCFFSPFFSFGHCIVSSSFYVFWLPLCYLLVIVLSLLPFTASDYSFVIFWSLHCLSFHLVSDYTFGIFWSLYCLSFHLQFLITPLVSFSHCTVSPSIYSFWLHLWYHLVIVLSLLQFTTSDYTFGIFVIVLSLLPFTASDYPFGIFWSLYCLSFHLQLLITLWYLFVISTMTKGYQRCNQKL
jgi:hypothetical protein